MGEDQGRMVARLRGEGLYTPLRGHRDVDAPKTLNGRSGPPPLTADHTACLAALHFPRKHLT